MSRVIRRPAANHDLVAIYRHYTRAAGSKVADRFFAQAEATFVRLAGMPGMGTRYDPEERLYADLRFFPVSRYRDYLVFYRPLPDGIEVYRVLHGARDLAGILAEDFDVADDEDEDDAAT